MVNNFYNDKKGSYDIGAVSIETVDQAIYDYFDKKLNVTVDVNNDSRKKVPVIYATGERWSMIRDQKGIRDENGTLILPLITVQRLNIDRTPGFGGMAQEVPYVTVRKTIHPKTSNLQNMIERRRRNGYPQIKNEKVVHDILTIPYPDFCIFYYQIMFWTQYLTQMNEIMEKIFYEYDHMDSFKIPVSYDQPPGSEGNGYYFVGFRDGDLTSESNMEEFSDQERILRYSYTIKVPVYLILNPKDKSLSYGKDRGEQGSTGKARVYREQSVTEIKFNQEKDWIDEDDED
jgi:hypothetical protein